MSDSLKSSGVSSQQEVKQAAPVAPSSPTKTAQTQATTESPSASVEQAPAPAAPAPAAPAHAVNAQPQQAPAKPQQAPAPVAQGTPLQAPPATTPHAPPAAPTLSKREIEAQNLLNLRELNDEEVISLELHQLLKAKARAIGVCEENDTSELTPEERTRMSWAIHTDTQVALDHIPHQVFLQKVWCLGPSERLDRIVQNLTGSSHYRSGGDHITALDTAHQQNLEK